MLIRDPDVRSETEAMDDKSAVCSTVSHSASPESATSEVSTHHQVLTTTIHDAEAIIDIRMRSGELPEAAHDVDSEPSN
jgi:hypothetical protein